MKKINLALVVILINISFSFSQINIVNDDMKRPLSARAVGLGNAYTALVNDATAIYWNPGALGMLRYSSITTGGWMGKNFSNLKESTEGSVDFYYDSDVSSKMKFGFNEFSAAVPIPFDDYSDFYVVPSFSYHEASNSGPFSEEWTVDYEDDFYNTAQDKFIFDQSGSRKELSFGLGFGLGEFVGLGIVYNRIMGELDFSVTQEFIFNGSTDFSDTYTENYDYEGSSLTIGIKASTIEASEYEFGSFGDYGDGVDFGFTLTFPHQRKTDFRGQGLNDITFTTEPTRITGGLAFRLTDYMISLDGSFVDYSNDYTVRTSSIGPLANLVIIPNSNSFDNLTTFSIGIEGNQMLRAGVMFRNYQFRQGDENKQPWTTAISAGLTAELSENIFWDFSAQGEFFKVEEMISNGGGSLDYKGVSFNMFTTLRAVIPY